MKFPKLPRKIRVPLIFCVFSILWIVLSDRFVLFITSDIRSATTIAIIKGTIYVLISTLLIYLLLAVDERRKATLESELKMVQDGFSALFEDNPQPMWINEPDSQRFLTVNQAALKLYGYSREEFLALHLRDLFVAEEQPLLDQAIQVVLGGLIKSGPWTMRKRDGEILITYIAVVNVEFSNHKNHMATVIDISEQKRIEETLKKTESERDDFESFGFAVSHDLRSSLRAVTGYSQVLMDDFGGRLGEKGQEYLGKVMQAGENMNHTLDKLLMLSGISHRSIHFEYIDLSKIAREIADELQKQAPERKVTFKIIPEVFARTDAELMRVLLNNLIENAWKFTSKNPIASIEFGCIFSQSGERVFFVKDNGVGFDPDKVTQMFKPFERFHEEEEYSGSGVGLNMVARIVERHQGRVWAEGKVDGGATFYFTLGMDDEIQEPPQVTEE